ncbi:MAG: insulinase family protein [Elusimicrobia bacterium]|nr:insulinase family protein [Elusimicrobiota bacterium]
MNRLLVAALLALAPQAFAQELPKSVPTTELDRATPVEPGPARPFSVSAPEEAQLKRGMKIALAQVSRLPIVSVRVVLPYGGSAFEPDGKAGLAGFVASLMMEGTRNLPRARFAEKLDDLGATLSVDAQADGMVATLFTTKENLDKSLGLMSAMLREPALPQGEFDRIKAEAQVGLQAELGDPGKVADRRLGERIFEGHPYGRQADAASVASITLDDVKAFQAATVRPDGAVLAVSGAVSMPELRKLAEKHFGGWKPSAVPLPDEVPAVAEQAPAAPARGMTIDVIDMPGSIQSAIRVGHRSIARDAPDYYAVAVMNYVLGQMPITGRLEKNLRETNNWAYGAGSAVQALKKGGVFSAEADVQTDATAKALLEMLREFSRMRDEKVPEEELAAVKRFMAGTFVLRQQTIQSIGGQIAGMQLYGLPGDTVARYRERIAAVTADDVQAAARAHLRAGDLQVVIVGDAAKIRAELGQIAPVRVVDADGNSVTPAPAPPSPEPRS